MTPARALTERVIASVIVQEDGTIALTAAFGDVARDILAVTDERMRAELVRDLGRLHETLCKEGAPTVAAKLERLAAQLRPKGLGALDAIRATPDVGRTKEHLGTFHQGIARKSTTGVSIQRRPPPKK